jgi:hypothetical protein
MTSDTPALMELVEAIAVGDDASAARMLAASPPLAKASVTKGATRQAADAHWFVNIMHYVYAGDTALHVAAAGYRRGIMERLIALGADVRAKNRRGAEPLHYAVDGIPDGHTWNPDAQAASVACLLKAGADPDARDLGGVTPLHRAVRNRCAAAVRELLDGGADVSAKNRSGSTPMLLAHLTTGRGGTGSAGAKAQQEKIVRLLERHGGSHSQGRASE